MTRLWVVERNIQINNFIKIKVDYGYLKSSHEQEKIKSILIYFKTFGIIVMICKINRKKQ